MQLDTKDTTILQTAVVNAKSEKEEHPVHYLHHCVHQKEKTIRIIYRLQKSV